jgi:hypothetical protein
MASQIKTVTDKAQFSLLMNNFFARGDVYIQTSSGDMKCQFLGYSEDNAAFRLPGIKNVPETVIAFTRHGQHTIYSSLKFLERNEDTYIFMPIKFQIISTHRKENRQMLEVGGGGKNIIYVENIITDFFIFHSLEMHARKNDKIREIAEFELNKQFKHVKIVFSNEAKNDIRMKHVREKKTPIFVPDLNSDPEPKYEEMYNYYINYIYSKDYQITGSHKYTSEAMVPIMHRKAIPYGYIQVNSQTPMGDGQFAVISRMAIVVDQLFIKEKRFESIPGRFLVSDISRSGLGIVFKDRSQARNFRKESLMAFDMLLPTSKKVVMSAYARNIIFMDSGLIKIGCQIDTMDETSQNNYNEYLDLLSRE